MSLNDLSQQVRIMARDIQELKQQVVDLTATIAAKLQVSVDIIEALPRVVEPRVKLPDPFCGDRRDFFRFVNACHLYFRLCPVSSGDDSQRLGIVMSLLRGSPQTWAFSLPSGSPNLRSLEDFFKSLAVLYEDPDRVSTAEYQLRTLTQGRMEAETFCSEFRRWAGETNWGEAALRSQFLWGLNNQVKDYLVAHSPPESLEMAMQLVIRIDRRIRDRRRQEVFSVSEDRSIGGRVTEPVPMIVSPQTEEPMQVGAVSTKTRKVGKWSGPKVCYYCGARGHFIAQCNRRGSTESNVVKRKTPTPFDISEKEGVVNPARLAFFKSGGFFVLGESMCKGTMKEIQIFIDSGSALNLVDTKFVLDNALDIQELETPIPVTAIDDSALSQTHITQRVCNIELRIQTNHTEDMDLFVMSNLPSPVVLGLPWLRTHNPSIDWKTGVISAWGFDCMGRCCKNLVAAVTISSIPKEIEDFAEVFSEPVVQRLPPHREYDCTVDFLPGAVMPKSRLFSLSVPERESMKEYISKSLAAGHIRPSKSPVAVGFFFIKKKDGGLRPCLDFREINKITVRNPYPLPLIPDLFNQLVGARWFSKIDLRGAYNLLRMKEGDEWKTAFNTPLGHFENLVMPFGLTNAPAFFQNFMNDILSPVLGRGVLVYLDDILIYTDDLESHWEKLREVLGLLRANCLYAKMEKCMFAVQKLSFLGFILSKEGFEMDPIKVEAVRTWSRPENLKSVQRFLGFANYYRKFIRNFSVVAKPITDLTKKGARIQDWSPEAINAFETLKKAFTSAPILIQPDEQKPFLVEVDASAVGVGAVLSQEREGKRHPCAFFSKKFSAAELNYDVGDRELLAIKLAFEHWRHFLEGARQQVQVFTDHKNLIYLEAAKRLNARQARWALFFARFNFTVSYVPGDKNIKADALSRSFSPRSEIDKPETILKKGVVLAALDAQLEELILNAQQNAPRGVPHGKLFVPTRLRERLLSECHESRLAGHPGIAETKKLVRRNFWWPGWATEVSKMVEGCAVCARSKASHTQAAGLLHPLPIPKGPWTHLSMDFITDLPRSEGHTVIWVIVDRFSKMCHLVPFTKLPCAKTLAKAFVKEIVRLHGVPVDIVSDRGPQFVAQFWRAFCGRLGIKLSFSSGYHPESNGQTERKNQDVEQFLRCFVADSQEDWLEFLPLAEFALNNHSSSAAECSPFFCNTGRHPIFGAFSGIRSTVPEEEDFSNKMEEIWKKVHKNLEGAALRAKRGADKRRREVVFTKGEMVWLSAKNLKLKVPSKKLGPKFVGPFKVIAVVNEVAVKLDIPKDWGINPVFHISLLKKTDQGCTEPSVIPPLNQDGEYEISRILDSRISRGGLQYLVAWKGFGAEDNSWIRASDVSAPRLVAAFHRRCPGNTNIEDPEAPRRGGGTVRSDRVPGPMPTETRESGGVSLGRNLRPRPTQESEGVRACFAPAWLAWCGPEDRGGSPGVSPELPGNSATKQDWLRWSRGDELAVSASQPVPQGWDPRILQGLRVGQDLMSEPGEDLADESISGVAAAPPTAVMNLVSDQEVGGDQRAGGAVDEGRSEESPDHTTLL